MVKKLLSIVLSAAMFFSAVTFLLAEKNIVQPETAVAAASEYTADQAIDFCKSVVGQAIDMDGKWGAQCVDFYDWYLDKLGYNWKNYLVGVAADLTYKSMPSDWTRIKGAQPQKGDVLVYTNGYRLEDGTYCGHVAIYESDYVTYHQNYNGQYVEKVTYKYNSIGSPTYWGVLRPNFKSAVPKGHVMSQSEAAGQTIPDGDYWIYSKVSNYILDIAGRLEKADNKTKVQLYHEPLGLFDAYTVKYLGNGFYNINQYHQDVSLDVANGGLERGTIVQAYETMENNEHQEWSIVRKGDVYKMQARSNSFFMDATGGVASDGVQIQTWTANDSNAQLWEFVPIGTFEGSGTKDDPYQISSADDLRKLSEYINNEYTGMMYNSKYYIQTADIDLDNEVFTPIGKYLHPNDNYIQHTAFNGTYDGDGHKITGLNAQNDNFYYVGLFGRTNENSVIKNLSVYGDVVGTQWCTGGIVGEVGYGGKVYNCSFNGTVTGAQMVGGITSSVQAGGTISGCYINASVSAPLTGERSWAGGIVGRSHIAAYNNATDIEISNCYFVGEVSGETAGDIVGKTEVDDNSKTKCTYSGNYYLKQEGKNASGDNSITASGAKAISESMMKNIDEILGEPFVHNDFKSINDGYPVFSWQIKSKGDANNDGTVSVADAVMLEKWLIGSSKDLTCWQNVDLCEDGKIDVFDMVMLRRHLISKK